MSDKHTPGEWNAAKHDGRWFVEAMDRAIPGYRTKVAHCAHVTATPHAEADAKLLAAAPELLEALHEIHAVLEEAIDPDTSATEIDVCDILGTASRAIAKAEGGSDG